jgi:hypothetical protein
MRSFFQIFTTSQAASRATSQNGERRRAGYRP